MTVVGVDGWTDGWVAAVVDGRHIEWRAYPQPRRGAPRDAFDRLLADHAGRIVAVDIPLELADGPRRSDGAARAFLAARGATPHSLFPTPSRAVVAAYESGHTHAEAMAGRAPGTPGTSIQAWNLIAKTVEVRAAVGRRRPDIAEAHPECSFRLMDPRIGPAGKKTARGVGLRLRALGAHFDLPDLADAPDGVPVDDLLDAVAVAWTADRIENGREIRLPESAAPGEPTIAV